jgi:hypothetical protein
MESRQYVFFRILTIIGYRVFCLNVSKEVLQDLLHEDYLLHWRLFTRAYRLLIQEEVTGREIDYAELLLKLFYDNVETLYGGELCTIKVHQLIHAADVVRNFGPLPNVSSRY